MNDSNDIVATWYPKLRKFMLNPALHSRQIANVIGGYSFAMDRVDDVLEKLGDYGFSLTLEYPFGEHAENNITGEKYDA